MRMPKTPPDIETLLAEIGSQPSRLEKVLLADCPPVQGAQYLHWHKLRYHPPPGNLSHEEWWLAVKLSRRRLYQEAPLWDGASNDFRFLICDPLPEFLHQIDLGAGGHIHMPDQITNPDTKDQYYVNSLIEEAITSSQLEGAATTRQVAKAMIKADRQPRDRSERMILNNYRTMKRLGEMKEEPLSQELVLEIHRLVTEGTLDDPSATGRFRRPDESVSVEDMYGQVLHSPPSAASLDTRIAALCDFANDTDNQPFIHPAVRSIILHFALAYDHPFVNGNGRTARALFYWSMLRRGYWLFEFISISNIILKAPAKYGRAFLYTETDESDLTYFILYHLKIIRRAVRELHEYLDKKAKELRRMESELRGVAALNHRQRALIGHALRHPHFRYTIASHRRSHNVVYQTARTDLFDLRNRGLLEERKVGRQLQFSPVSDLADKLARLD